MLVTLNETETVTFWSHVDRRSDDECWEWQLTIVRGYGRWRIRGEGLAAHRLAWTLTNGEITDGLYVCHHCDNRRCVNPSHLFLGTARDDTQDMIRKGRKATPMADKTHCKNGHEFTPENTHHGRGQRSCRACHRLAVKRTREARRAQQECS